MQFPEFISDKEYAEISRQSLRLFLSVDIVNSTALKQEFRHSGRSWLEIAHGFYTRFPSNLSAQQFVTDIIRGDGPAQSPPFLWKALGDELVFVAEIKKMAEVPLLVEGFRAAINAWNTSHEEAGVSVKATAWLAGFPVMNSVIPGDSTGHYDYLGSSIDIGFRLSKYSSPRNFVVSVELAYTIATLRDELARDLCYNGKRELKGVLRDRPYPLFSLDCFKAISPPAFATLAKLEDKLAGKNEAGVDSTKITEFTREWIHSTNGDICLPFCCEEESEDFPVSAGYKARHLKAIEELEREFIEASETPIDDGNDEGLETFWDTFDGDDV